VPPEPSPTIRKVGPLRSFMQDLCIKILKYYALSKILDELYQSLELKISICQCIYSTIWGHRIRGGGIHLSWLAGGGMV